MPNLVQAPAAASIDRVALVADALRGADTSDWQVPSLCFAEEVH